MGICKRRCVTTNLLHSPTTWEFETREKSRNAGLVISCTSEQQGGVRDRVIASLFLPPDVKTKGERETDFLKHARKRTLFNAR